ncbi:FimD/PapC N-terminal domain-containing protein, partial [Pseudomonas aeruginosa]|uniref:FimD/PapC N-terminal domain-containing protein n=1 Tax=Pseudomonas aeruginosa TaxID=287 RepID=UPI0031B6FA22
SFQKKGYVDAGKYNLRVFINKQSLSDEYDINWYVSENDPTKTYACLTPELVAEGAERRDSKKPAVDAQR